MRTPSIEYRGALVSAGVLIFVANMAVPTIAGAATPLPKVDRAGTADNPLIKRYEGSVIISYEQKAFEEFTFPLSKLEPMAGGKRDPRSRLILAPKRSKSLEGSYTRILYLLPSGRTSLEAIRNYAQELQSRGAKTLYECKEADCGGDPRRNVFSTSAGEQSLSMYLYPEERVRERNDSPGYCAMDAGISKQRYLLIELPGGTHVSVLAYETPEAAGGNCSAFAGATFAAVDIVVPKEREQKMVTVNAAQMADSIAGSGKVALYGIYFDAGKAEIKSSSDATLEQIGKLLNEKPSLKLLVVGHTDNAGGFSANMDLSQRRAAATAKALEARFGVRKQRLVPVGVSCAAPVASNSTEEGRAKNRRVELVEP